MLPSSFWPSHLKIGIDCIIVEAHSVLELDGLGCVFDIVVLFGPFCKLLGDTLINIPGPLGQGCQVELDIHQYIFLGSCWLRRYFFQRDLAWAAFTLRRVVGLI